MPATAWSTYTKSVAAARAGPLDYLFYISTDETLWFCTIHKTNPRSIARNPTQIVIDGTQPIRLADDKHCAFAAGIGPDNHVHLIYTVGIPGNPGAKYLAETFFDGTNWKQGTLPQNQYGTHSQTTLDVTSANYTPLCVYYTSPEPQPKVVTAWMNSTRLWQAQQLQP